MATVTPGGAPTASPAAGHASQPQVRAATGEFEALLAAPTDGETKVAANPGEVEVPPVPNQPEPEQSGIVMKSPAAVPVRTRIAAQPGQVPPAINESAGPGPAEPRAGSNETGQQQAKQPVTEGTPPPVLAIPDGSAAPVTDPGITPESGPTPPGGASPANGTSHPVPARVKANDPVKDEMHELATTSGQVAAVTVDKAGETTLASAVPATPPNTVGVPGQFAHVMTDGHTLAAPEFVAADPQPAALTAVPGAPISLPVNPTDAAEPRNDAPKGADAVTLPAFTAGVAAPSIAAPNGTAIVQPATPAPTTAGSAGEQVAMHVSQALSNGEKTVTVELHPAELGRVEIRLSFHSDGMSLQMTVDRPETFDAFSRDRAGLEQQLTQAGVDFAGGGLDLRLGQQSGQPEGYFNARNSRVMTPAPLLGTIPAMRWVGNSLIDILA
jgi:hypothetical protein